MAVFSWSCRHALQKIDSGSFNARFRFVRQPAA
jgi:hypothetical protein